MLKPRSEFNLQKEIDGYKDSLKFHSVKELSDRIYLMSNSSHEQEFSQVIEIYKARYLELTGKTYESYQEEIKAAKSKYFNY